MCIAGLCRVLCGEDRAERTSAGTEALLTAAERQGALEERAKASEGINTQSHTRYCSDPEPFTSGRRAQSLFFKLLGLKSGFIFTLASQPVCSSKPRSC